jgi:HAE1 family hydrophobic/amphiphilic exporter-1
MKIADVSVNRPVFALMISAALLVLGGLSYRTLGVDLMPKTDVPIVTISVALPGASAEEVESQLTKPIEEAVNGIAGIDELSAVSDQGMARVTVTFTLERDIEAAVQDVRDKIAGIVGRFPQDTRPAIIQKIDPDAAPILIASLAGPRSLKEITDIADKRVKQVLETVDGVGDIQFTGDRHREIQLLLNADRLTAYGLTVDQVRQAVQRQNVEIPGGTFKNGSAEIALRTMGRIQTADDFNRIIVSYRADGSAITFADIGHVEDTTEEARSTIRRDGETTVGMIIRKQSGANTIEVVNRIMARIERIKATIPPDLNLLTDRDQSRFIRRSLEDIRLHLILGGLLAAAVVFLFIRNLRVTLIAGLAIPVSIIGTFTVMKAFGFTMNNMTMLALSLATGIVIDDAIVVLENIFRYVEEKGVSPREAAAAATSEIGLAVMATTFSLVVIFLPVAFMTGAIGRYFYSFGVTSAAAIILSMLVSFTLTPALCAWWLRKEDTKSDHSTTRTRGFYGRLDATYGRLLVWSLKRRAVMMGVAGLTVISAFLIYPYLGKELVPDDDQGEFSINVRLPRGTNFETTDQYARQIEAEVKNLPEQRRISVIVNVGQAMFPMAMTPLEERDISQQEVMRQARAMLRKYKGARIAVSGGTDLSGASSFGPGGGGGTNRLNILIQGPDIEQLQTYVTELMDKVRTIPGVVDVDTNFETTQSELRVVTDRARAADLGVSIDSLASSLRTLVGGEEVSRYKDGDDQYAVRLRLEEPFRRDPATLGSLLIPSRTQGAVKVSDVAELKMERGPASIQRYNRQRQISVFANLDRIALGDAVTLARQKVNELHMKPGYQAVFGGGARQLDEASNDFLIAVILAVAFIYMVLASQFNSFVHPLTIMTALPLSLPAGLLALLITRNTINVYSAIGLMMLFGIVKKNSILQVDYTNTLRAQGMERHEALIAANHVRLRPILMTTMAIVAGMIPIAFGRGAGAGSRASMAVTIIGGQLLCLLLTLLVTPIVYSYFDDLREWSPIEAFRRLRRTPPPVDADAPGV